MALMVLAGMVNKKLVAAIGAAGKAAIGLLRRRWNQFFRARKKSKTDGCDPGICG